MDNFYLPLKVHSSDNLESMLVNLKMENLMEKESIMNLINH